MCSNQWVQKHSEETNQLLFKHKAPMSRNQYMRCITLQTLFRALRLIFIYFFPLDSKITWSPLSSVTQLESLLPLYYCHYPMKCGLQKSKYYLVEEKICYVLWYHHGITTCPCWRSRSSSCVFILLELIETHKFKKGGMIIIVPKCTAILCCYHSVSDQ